MCLYCLDIGLINAKLREYSASLRCTAVVVLLRRILQSQTHCICDWTDRLAEVTNMELDKTLNTVCNLYAQALEENIHFISCANMQNISSHQSPFKV